MQRINVIECAGKAVKSFDTVKRVDKIDIEFSHSCTVVLRRRLVKLTAIRWYGGLNSRTYVRSGYKEWRINDAEVAPSKIYRGELLENLLTHFESQLSSIWFHPIALEEGLADQGPKNMVVLRQHYQVFRRGSMT